MGYKSRGGDDCGIQTTTMFNTIWSDDVWKSPKDLQVANPASAWLQTREDIFLWEETPKVKLSSGQICSRKFQHVPSWKHDMLWCCWFGGQKPIKPNLLDPKVLWKPRDKTSGTRAFFFLTESQLWMVHIPFPDGSLYPKFSVVEWELLLLQWYSLILSGKLFSHLLMIALKLT